MRLLIVDVSRALGLFPYDKKGIFKKLRYFYSTMVVIVFLGTMSFCRAKTFSIKASTTSFQQNISNALQILQMTTLVVHLISMWFYRRKLEMFQGNRRSKKCSFCSYCLMVPLGVIFVCLVPYGMAPVKTSIYNKFFVSAIGVNNFFNWLVVLQYSHMLKTAFQAPEIVFECPKARFSTVNFFIGDELNKDVLTLVKAYGCQMLLIYINSFGWLIWGMYYVLWSKHFSGNMSSMIWLSVSIMQKVMTLCIPCDASERFYRRMDEHYNRLFQIMRDDPLLYKQASLFLYVTKKQKAKLTVCGFFTLGYPLITSIITGSATYLVVLIQFGSNK